MKFIADVMLGRLARRMRLMGFDVLYDRRASDNDVIRLSLENNRVILTRDRGLASRPLASNHLMITSDHVDEQAQQVLDAFRIGDEAHFFTRCSLCNEPLRELNKKDALDLVPRYVYEAHDGFFRCDACGRVYWKGTHVNRMLNAKKAGPKPRTGLRSVPKQCHKK